MDAVAAAVSCVGPIGGDHEGERWRANGLWDFSSALAPCEVPMFVECLLPR